MGRRVGGSVALLALVLSVAGARADVECDWPMYGRDLGRTFAAPESCSSITPLNAPTLAPKWYVETGSPVTASPSVVDGVVYVGANAGPLYAVDAETGEIDWIFEIPDGNRNYVGKIVASAAVSDVGGKRVVVIPGGSTLYVLDADDGSILASLCTDPRAHSEPRCEGSDSDIDILSSPAIVEVGEQTWIVVGHDVHNRANVGRTGILAVRLEPGEPWTLEAIWKFDPEAELSYTTDENKDGEDGYVYTTDPLTYGHGTGQGCGGVWSSPAVDTEAGMVFFGTASCSRDGPTSGESMWGIDLTSGAYRWQYDPRGERSESRHFDDDFGASPNLLPGGLVGEGSKDGWYYARDRVTGEEAWTAHPGQSGRVNSDFSIGGIIGTTALGEVNGEPAVFATTAISTPFSEEQPDPSLLEDPLRMLSIHALSAADGRILWRSPLSRQSYGAPTYANGVVFVPSTVDFAINVFHADTGVLLRRVPLNGAPSSAPALVGDSLYIGSGTTEQGLPLDDLSGIWAFRVLG
ncbi:MAG TPA: PQQ-binding-like beta-propeller repeat protein [Actinomycetota bacterium]